MSIYSGLFNSVNGDRKYNAWWFAKYFSTFIGNGVFPNPSVNLQVVENENMNVTVKPGLGWINGYFLYSDSDYVLQHDLADGVLKRIDRIVMRLDYLSRQIEIVVKKGAFGSVPVAPALQRDADAYELALADVLINNGATEITQANITDLRLNSELCGIVHGVVDQVDTTTIFNQYQAWMQTQIDLYEGDLLAWTEDKKTEFEQWQQLRESDFDSWQAQEKANFDDWFANVVDILDGDVAGNLLNQIIQLGNDLQLHSEKNASLTEKGHVQLSSATDSTSESFAATPKAVKEAMDKANDAFTSANDGKNLLKPTIIGKGGEVEQVGDVPTYEELNNGIESIPTGESYLFDLLGSVIHSVDEKLTYMPSGNNRIVAYDREGNLIMNKQIPSGIVISVSKGVYGINSSSVISFWDFDFNLLFNTGIPGSVFELIGSNIIYRESDNTIFGVSNNRNNLLVYDATGNLLQTVSMQGQADQSYNPFAQVMINPHDTVYCVTNRYVNNAYHHTIYTFNEGEIVPVRYRVGHIFNFVVFDFMNNGRE